jgi:hypothetical protein
VVTTGAGVGDPVGDRDGDALGLGTSGISDGATGTTRRAGTGAGSVFDVGLIAAPIAPIPQHNSSVPASTAALIVTIRRMGVSSVQRARRFMVS